MAAQAVLSDESLAALDNLSKKIATIKEDIMQQEEANGIADKENPDVVAMETDHQSDSEMPKGQNEEDNSQYFLAIADLQEANGLLREQEAYTQQSIKSLADDIQETQGAIATMVEIRHALTDKENMNDNKKSDTKSESSTEESEVAKIESKIKSTRTAFKELKDFLGEYLGRVDPVNEETGEGGELSNLLQELWTAFQNKLDDTDKGYVVLSDLAFDVKNEHIELLLNNGLIEKTTVSYDDASDPDAEPPQHKICLVGFTK